MIMGMPRRGARRRLGIDAFVVGNLTQTLFRYVEPVSLDEIFKRQPLVMQSASEGVLINLRGGAPFGCQEKLSTI